MKRLIDGLGVNSPQEYDRIYDKRKREGVDQFDLKRWHKLLKYYKGGRLVDLGCLDSLVPQLALDSYPKAEVWGIDTATEAIKALQKEKTGVLYEVADVYDTHFPSNYFDYAVAGELIEHLDDPARFIKETFRTLKHGGVFAISTPCGETELGEVDHERHLWSFEVEDIKKLLEPYGKVKVTTMGSQYFPIYEYHFPNIIAFCFKV